MKTEREFIQALKRGECVRTEETLFTMQALHNLAKRCLPAGTPLATPRGLITKLLNREAVAHLHPPDNWDFRARRIRIDGQGITIYRLDTEAARDRWVIYRIPNKPAEVEAVIAEGLLILEGWKTRSEYRRWLAGDAAETTATTTTTAAPDGGDRGDPDNPAGGEAVEGEVMPAGAPYPPTAPVAPMTDYSPGPPYGDRANFDPTIPPAWRRD